MIFEEKRRNKIIKGYDKLYTNKKILIYSIISIFYLSRNYSKKEIFFALVEENNLNIE